MESMEDRLPPCGLYRTRVDVAGVPAGRLVYFHNHGDPGRGLYLPERWVGNRAVFRRQGHTLPSSSHAITDISPLAAEGLYRVVSPFHCCERKCRLYETDMLVQLGYDGAANAILFVPEWSRGALAIPASGTRIEPEKVSQLSRLRVPEQRAEGEPDDQFVH